MVVGVAGKVGEASGSGRAGVSVAKGIGVKTISDGSADGGAGDVGEGSPPEPIPPGGGTSAREHASVARISAARGSQSLHRLAVRLASKLPSTRNLIEFIAACTRF